MDHKDMCLIPIQKEVEYYNEKTLEMFVSNLKWRYIVFCMYGKCIPLA